MTDYRVLLAAVGFLLVLLWRFRPALFGDGEVPRFAPAMKARLDSAKDDHERAMVLAEAGDTLARSIGGARNAAAYYGRAMRLEPESTELVSRAAAALSRRHRTLESLLWRRLGTAPWEGGERGPALQAIRELARLYDATAKTRPRARAMEHLLASLGAKGDP